MSNAFDAYHKWLSIPPSEQPPHYYRLLGLGLFESDLDVIQAAADRQMSHVQTYKNGPQASLSQQLLNEISAAKLCLLKPQKKSAYDEKLREQLRSQPAAASGMANPATAAAPQAPRPTQPMANGNGTPGVASQGAPSGGGGGAWRTGNSTPPGGFPAGLSPAALNSAGLNPTAPKFAAPKFTAPSSPGPNSPSQNAAAMLAAGRTASVARPPVAPAEFAATEEEQSERSWSIPPAAAILAAASVVAVLLVIGIILILGQRSAHNGSQNRSGTETVAGGTTPPNDPASGNASGGNASVQPGANDVHSNPPSSGQTPPGQTATGTSGGFNNSPSPFGVTPSKSGTQTSGPTEANADPKAADPKTAVPKTTDPSDTGSKPPDKSVAMTLPIKKPPVKGTDSDPLAVKGPTKGPASKTTGKADGRLAVPDASALAAAETDLATMAPNASVADLLQRVGQRPPAAEAYVALRKALQLSINDGDAITALNVVDQLCHAFAVDDLDVRSHALTELRAKVREPAGCEATGEAGLTLIDDAVAADNLQMAGRIAELTLSVARRSGNNELIRKVTSRILKLRQDQPKAF